MKKYVSLGIILIFFLVVFASGCTSSGNTTANSTKYEDKTPPVQTKAVETHPVQSHSLSSSTFQLPTIWESKMKDGFDSLIFTSTEFPSSTLAVWQLLDKEAYTSEREDTYNPGDSSFIIIESTNKTINNTNVEVFKFKNSESTGITYFFEKNKKFYKLVINTKTKSELDNTKLNITIEDIVSTMN